MDNAATVGKDKSVVAASAKRIDKRFIVNDHLFLSLICCCVFGEAREKEFSKNADVSHSLITTHTQDTRKPRPFLPSVGISLSLFMVAKIRVLIVTSGQENTYVGTVVPVIVFREVFCLTILLVLLRSHFWVSRKPKLGTTTETSWMLSRQVISCVASLATQYCQFLKAPLLSNNLKKWQSNNVENCTICPVHSSTPTQKTWKESRQGRQAITDS